MKRKKKKQAKKIVHIETIDRRAKKYRKINLKEKEIIVFNEDLKEFQLLPPLSASYEETSEPCNG